MGLNSASRTDDAGVHSYVQFMQLTLCIYTPWTGMQHHYQTAVSCRPRVNITNFCGPAVVGVHELLTDYYKLPYEDVASPFISDADVASFPVLHRSYRRLQYE